MKLRKAHAILLAIIVGPLRSQSSQWTTGSGGAIYYNGGNVGIGTASPIGLIDAVSGSGNIRQQLHIGQGTTNGLWLGTAGNTSNMNLTAGGHYDGSNFIADDTSAARLMFNFGTIILASDAGLTAGQPYSPTSRVWITPLGNVGIGTTNPQYPLSVNGTIQAKEVIVNTGWSDYVFQSDYPLQTLTEVAAYINRNHHLPDIPSASEVEAKGVSLGDMQSKLLAKIEEMTLQMIQEHERNVRLEKQNQDFQQRLSRLESTATIR